MQRKVISYEPFPFDVKEKEFLQYASIYFTRLNLLKPRLTKSIQEWQVPIVHKLLDIQMGVVCAVIGTVYVNMSDKPCIMEEVTREQWVIPSPPKDTWYSDQDEYFLEDESGRIKLVDMPRLVTGVTVGLQGYETDSGEFKVLDIVYPDTPLPPLPMENDDAYIAFVSGLEIGKNSPMLLKHQLLLEFLTGEHSTRASQISKVFFVGNSLGHLNEEDQETTLNKYGSKVTCFDESPIDTLDRFFAALCCNMDVHVMSGEYDPVNCLLPQQPILPFIFKEAVKYSSFSTETNPFKFVANGIHFLGTSGQTVDDLKHYLPEERIEVANKTLEWGHMAPTCPDTLWCHPFKAQDPFVLTERPHVYFIGNQPSFEVIEKNGTLTICLPKFSQTSQIVLVNTKTLKAETIVFE